MVQPRSLHLLAGRQPANPASSIPHHNWHVPVQCFWRPLQRQRSRASHKMPKRRCEYGAPVDPRLQSCSTWLLRYVDRIRAHERRRMPKCTHRSHRHPLPRPSRKAGLASTTSSRPTTSAPVQPQLHLHSRALTLPLQQPRRRSQAAQTKRPARASACCFAVDAPPCPTHPPWKCLLVCCLR